MASSAMLQNIAVASSAATSVARFRSIAAAPSSQRVALGQSHLGSAKVFFTPARIGSRSSSHRAATQVVALKDPSSQDNLKRAVAKKAIELVKSGMVVGLGTGSTSSMAIEELGNLIQANKLKDIVGVATSYQSKVLARQFGVKTVDLNDVNHIDIAFDGADEVDSGMSLIKGGGAAHTMEKVVDSIAKECVILIDETKVVKTLGLSFPVPVEVLPFALAPVLRALAALGGQPEIRTALRKDGPVITDLGNMVVDVRFPEGVKDPAEMETKINMIPGVIDNGLFINVAHKVLVGTKDGDETSVVEFAEFVSSMKSSTEGVSA
ncbi:uncharacterized protein [Physcomitrium patens]|uniref:ribose-5-phosphate isomerase n=1 Tax=Physcomitrium patens TaxID=3218 RepID=A0A2K1IXK1_PHYPA|nr:uncharacterized protein LOC112272703 [Physcomitrium patens]XP_024356504.1 uncharacterized protein LOC112272703 [Physcomitrium patens]PNR34009.1 hypothetical protein PHYPA_023825 [Physcomitrium patens]|eukprot:XP_024356503.1 uncharacterized protein LOC112272703 [Physcomitrella patens]